MAVLQHLQDRCDEVWPGDVDIAQTYVKGEYLVLLHFGIQKSRNARLLPSKDIRNEITRVLAEEGFTEKPGWFTPLPSD